MRRRLRAARAAFLKLGWERERRIGGRSYRVGACLVPPPSFSADYEPWMDAVYAAALELGPGAVVDVGVNRMQTLFKALSLDPDRRYVGFEPQLPAVLAARDFASRNGLETVEIVCAGLSDAPGAAVLRLRSLQGFDGAASITDQRDEAFYKGRVTIPVLRGDDVFETMGLDDVRLINVDVEGAELEVFSGLRRVLETTRPVVAFEVLNDWSDPAGNPEAEAGSRRRSERARALGELLKAAGMRVFAVRREGLIPLDMIERVVSDDLSLCNYAAAPEEQAEAFEAGVQRRLAQTP